MTLSDTLASPAAPSDSGIDALVAVAGLAGVAADAGTLRHHAACDGPVDALTLVRLASRLGLKVRLLRPAPARWPQLPLPAIVEGRDGRFLVLLKLAGGEALLHDAAARRTYTCPLADLPATSSGRVILLASRATLAQGGSRFNLSWFIPAIVKYRRQFMEVLAGSLFLQLFGLVSPLFMQVVIDKVLVHKSMSTLDVLVFGLLTISIFESLLGGLRSYVFSHTTNRVDVELGSRLFRHLLGLPLAYFQARRVGDSVARVRELENIRSFLTGNALTVAMDLLFTLVFLLVMLSYSGLLTLVTLVSLPCYVALSLTVTPTLKRRLDDKFRRSAENQSFLVEAITGVETIKSMAVEPLMQRKWENQLAAYVTVAFRAANLASAANQAAALISKVSTAALLWFGAKMVIDGSLTVGELIAFNMLAGHVSAPVLRLAQLWQDFQQVRLSMARLGDILDNPVESASGAGRAALPALQGQVVFDQVVFRYQPGAPEVLRGLSLTVQPGMVIGIVGPSGSGKSTVTKLIQRLYAPERGRVLIDGMDLALLDPAALRRQIGTVLQENMLFKGTVRDNIAFAAPGMAFEQVVASARLAGAHDFILELPHGYDTELGERGTGLSGGQRQRIAIARALATDPKILIFDEATSALDAESEAVIQRNMQMICRGRTVFIIAHRLSAVRGAGRIITIDKGEIVEQGTHDELLQRRGRYAALWQHQTGYRHAA
ncbi:MULTISPECIES: type I secretion system permease/ATPase [unclassified Duganella]|uniref:type I secretion system permease/ATPase n=1 Tax=unclassified Duganella TaxID=2636909 RepID=UPI000E34FCC2|nr:MULTISPECIES: type I secretion system permease/ATPase [unclassified Duganella]RFP14603.1 type I secretion system permease/ATPase [Duganella sp. BJB475]RFP30951.1 type I secretion system permease/ATPase [Duganella sp. BJB476]